MRGRSVVGSGGGQVGEGLSEDSGARLQVGATREYAGLRVDVDARTDRIVVRVSAPLDLPFTPPGWTGTPRISATAASFVVVSD